MAEDSVPIAWIVLFIVIALGLGAAVVFYVGGSIVDSSGVIAPLGV